MRVYPISIEKYALLLNHHRICQRTFTSSLSLVLFMIFKVHPSPQGECSTQETTGDTQRGLSYE